MHWALSAKHQALGTGHWVHLYIDYEFNSFEHTFVWLKRKLESRIKRRSPYKCCSDISISDSFLFYPLFDHYSFIHSFVFYFDYYYHGMALPNCKNLINISIAEIVNVRYFTLLLLLFLLWTEDGAIIYLSLFDFVLWFIGCMWFRCFRVFGWRFNFTHICAYMYMYMHPYSEWWCEKNDLYSKNISHSLVVCMRQQYIVQVLKWAPLLNFYWL